MAIENFSLWRVLVSLVPVLIFVACQTTPKIQTPAQPPAVIQSEHSSGNAPVVSVVPPPPPSTGATSSIGGAIPPIKSLPTIELPKSEVPKIGLILGPGGMKTWSYIGVLRQLQNARIPIHSVVGMEWGAFIGALYAQRGQANDAEWQAMKVKDSELPGSGIFDSKIKRRGINILDQAFARSLGEFQVEQSKIEFACPTATIRGEKTMWQNRGSARAVMQRCVPYPPFFSDTSEYLAAPFALEDAAAWLRARGAQVIIFVDAISSSDIFSKADSESNYVENLLWQEVRKNFRRQAPQLANHVILLNTSKQSLVDVGSRRGLIELGSQQSADIIKSIAKKYGI